MKKIVTVLLVAILTVTSFGSVPAEAAGKEKPVTIFLHGLAGNGESMKPVIQGLSGDTKVRKIPVFHHKYRDPKTKVIHSYVVDVGCYGQGNTYVIAPDLTAKRYECTGGRMDMVSVIFAGDVKGNTASLELQMKMLKKITDDIPKALKSKKGVNEKSVNLVGHSMGGVLATNYALQSHKSKGSYLKVERLVTLDSPITGADALKVFKGVKSASAFSILFPKSWLKRPTHELYGAVSDLHDSGGELSKRLKTMKLDPNMKVLSVDALGDPIVTTNSALALKSYTKNFKSMSIKSSHSVQHQKSVIAAIKTHLSK